MTRTQHQLHPTKSLPVYCLDWTDDNTLLLGGGGGATKSGIGNKLKLCDVSKDGRRVKEVFELALSSEEDAPMTMALDRATSQFVTGINASQASIEGGTNEQCRIFSYAENQLSFVRSQNTINAKWSDDYPYQKLTALSVPPTEGTSASFVATGTTDNQLAILAFPSLEVVVSPFSVEGGDLVDLDWGGPQGTWLLVATAKKLTIYSFAHDGILRPIQSIDAPTSDDGPVAFRAVRFAPGSPARPSILAALNLTTLLRREARKKTRKAYIVKFDPAPIEEVEEGEKEGSEKQQVLDEKTEPESPSLSWSLANKREVASKPITVMDVSKDGRLVSFGCSDLSIGMLDALTLAPLLKILHAHSFPPTALKFNPSATMLVSASADNTIRTVIVPSSFGASVPSTLVMLVLALLVFVLAVLLRK